MSVPIARTHSLDILIKSTFIRDLLSRCGAAGKSAVAVAGLSLFVAACAGSEGKYEALRGYQPCYYAEAENDLDRRCEPGRNVLMAMATGQQIDRREVVEREVLEEQRGGFIAAGGMLINFGFRIETFVNGVPQLASYLSYNDMLAGRGSIPSSDTIVIGGGDLGATQIIHSMGGAGGIGATITTNQSGISIHSISTLAIDILNFRQFHKGGPHFPNVGRPLPLEFHETVVRALN